jgi:putative Ca2+/H+ antiporter (TMEM165/GDT1 family)
MQTPEILSVISTSFVLISLAEIGDKSQLVCMVLASRHRHWPVLLGSFSAFAVLNLLAVIFGAGVAAWLPEKVIAGIVAVLFGIFGIHALFAQDDENTDEVVEKPGHNIFITTFLLILVAEFGDKTQIAVAGLASSFNPAYVWLGSTMALLTISALGVWAGSTLLKKLPVKWLHRLSGCFFLIFAIVAAWHVINDKPHGHIGKEW